MSFCRLSLSFQWGAMFDVPTPTDFVQKTCKYNNFDYCCEVVNASLRFYPNNNGFAHRLHDSKPLTTLSWTPSSCNVTTKEYLPSPYEQRHLQYGMRVSNASERERLGLLQEIIWEDIEHTPRWLARVKYHYFLHQNKANKPEKRRQNKSSGKNETHRNLRNLQSISPSTSASEDHPDDLFYLSRFHFRTTCTNKADEVEWYEWIEPLTIYGRHPNALITCAIIGFDFKTGSVSWKGVTKPLPGSWPIYITTADYMIPANLEMAKNRLHFRHIQDKESHLSKKNGQAAHQQKPRAFFFDAGVSVFDTSLTYFTCMYAQQGIPFNHIYGWEYTLLEPQSFWSHVPVPMKSHYTFFNLPVSENQEDPDKSLLSMIGSTVSTGDFVSLKLDIDSPKIENKIALDILHSSYYSDRIDEFYYELHHRCPIMSWCAWGNSMPEEMHGIKLTIGHVLQFFEELRKKGIRAHMWV